MKKEAKGFFIPKKFKDKNGFDPYEFPFDLHSYIFEKIFYEGREIEMPIDLKKMSKEYGSKRLDLADFDYHALPYRSERSSDVEIEHEGLRAVTDDAVLVVIEMEETWIPRAHLVYIDQNTLTVSGWMFERLGL